MKALILIADRFEDVQVFGVWHRLREDAVEVTLASPGGRPVVGLHGYTIEADTPIREVNPSEYDLLVIPGGYASEALRLREQAVDIARTFLDEDRRVVVIGHGPQVLISAVAINGRHVACSPEIRDDVRAAGGVYRDECVVVDGNLVSCRGTDDLPELYRAMAVGVAVAA